MVRSPLSSYPRASVAVLTAGFVAGAVALGWLSIATNVERGCSAQDTPYLDLCGGQRSANAPEAAALRARIQRNPGDASAYVQLATADRSPERARLIQAAARLAPNHPDILIAQAGMALDRQDWAGAVKPLVQLAEYRDAPQATGVLGQLIAGGQGHLLAPYLTPGSHWFARTLPQMSQVPSSLPQALPLVAQALKLRLLDADAVRTYLRGLKATGAWVDAYSLWVSLHGKPLSTLYNGGFEDAFQTDGFDWEIANPGPPSRAGAVVGRRAAEERGTVLDIRFTGRAIAVPLVRQHLFLGPGQYRLRGEYMASQLRMEHGLAWTVRCTTGAAQAGRSDPLTDTGSAWQPFMFKFSIQPGCGAVTSLQLETYAPVEAALGARGRAAFDALALEQLAP